MTEIEIAAAEWVRAYERATPSRHPAYWAAHYIEDRMLGSVHAPPKRDLAKTAFIFLAPFGYCTELTDSFFVRDAQRHLEITRISVDGKGMRQTSWTLAYSIADDGKVTFPWPARKTHPADVIVGVCEAIGLCRLSAGMTYEFDEVFRGALVLAERNL
jgi:hypothetical protein